jgi:YHS domain-containing protein
MKNSKNYLVIFRNTIRVIIVLSILGTLYYFSGSNTYESAKLVDIKSDHLVIERNNTTRERKTIYINSHSEIPALKVGEEYFFSYGNRLFQRPTIKSVESQY